MRLENLSIAREDYGPNKGKYRCAVSFAGEFTKQSLILPSDVSNAILEAVSAHVIIAGEGQLHHRVRGGRRGVSPGWGAD